MNASDLLHLWDIGQSLSPFERLLFLLTSAGWQDPGSLTIGSKNRALLTLRQDLFGPQLQCTLLCPQCATRLEFTVSTAVLLSAGQEPPAQSFTVVYDPYTLTIRQPQLRDLQIAHGRGATLYEQCLLEVRCGEAAIAIKDLPEEARLETAVALRQNDPLLDIQLSLDCPDCGKSWSSPLDLLDFLWQEIEQWGRRMLGTVHRLASAYGWSENDILALSAWRRNRYLEMLHHG